MVSRQTWLGTCCVALATWAGCAQGIQRPAATKTVRIHQDLTFFFGPEAPCDDSSTVECAANTTVFPNEASMHSPRVKLDLLAFEIDAHEVTNLQYRLCVDEGACREPRGNNGPGTPDIESYYSASLIDWRNRFDNFPVLSVSHEDAEDYCEFLDKRLPTEAEWERAARGPLGRKYPVEGMASLSQCKGKIPTGYCQELAQANLEETPVWNEVTQDYESSSSDFVLEGSSKIFHLMGNVAEFVADPYQEEVTCDRELTAKTACKRCEACGEDANCKNECDNCLACPYADPARPECSYACGEMPKQSYWCVKHADSALDKIVRSLPSGEASDLNDFVVKGSSVTDTEACTHRSAYRDRNDSLKFNNGAYLHIGFRCARTIGSVGTSN